MRRMVLIKLSKANETGQEVGAGDGCETGKSKGAGQGQEVDGGGFFHIA